MIGVVAITPAGFFGFLALGVWTLMASIMLAMRAGDTGRGAAGDTGRLTPGHLRLRRGSCRSAMPWASSLPLSAAVSFASEVACLRPR